MLGAASEILPSLNAVEPDLAVIMVPDDHDGVEQVLKLLAAAHFRGKVMLMGSRSMPASQPRNGSASSSGSTCFPSSELPFARAS